MAVKANDIIAALYALHDDREWVSETEIKIDHAGHRVDFWTARKEYNLHARIYEIKVTRSDFLGDVKRGKWRHYLGHATHVIFIVPKGLVERAEVPVECGFATFDPDAVNPIQVHRLGPKFRLAGFKPLEWRDIPVLQVTFRLASRLWNERLEHQREIAKLEKRIEMMEVVFHA
jgi:hypothetical protein